MGYTHYWGEGTKSQISEGDWNDFLQDCKVILTHGVEQGIIADGWGEDACKLIDVEKYGVNFNGWANDNDDAHETCYFPAWEEIGKDFVFCKTAQKPYDVYVVACLTVLHARFGDLVDVRSDGDWMDWKEGVSLLHAILGRSWENPRPNVQD